MIDLTRRTCHMTNEQSRHCPTLGPTCRGCPDCMGIPFDPETDAWAREELQQMAATDMEERARRLLFEVRKYDDALTNISPIRVLRSALAAAERQGAERAERRAGELCVAIRNAMLDGMMDQAARDILNAALEGEDGTR